MHYVVFLTAHGFAPYRDIIDMNMPGSYLTDDFVIRFLGPGSGGELAWDLLNGVFVMIAALWIAGKEYRSAAVIAGSLAYLWHLKDGAWCLGERDWTVAALLLLSVGCLLQFVRNNRAIWTGAAFLCAGLAATIKPPAVMVTLACAILIAWKSRRDSSSAKAAISWSALGLSLPVAIVLLYLLKFHVFHDFLTNTTKLTSFYAGLQRQGLRYLLRVIDVPLKVCIPAFAFFLLNKSWRSTESLVLFVATSCALAMYILQGKGFPYHTYPVIAIALIWLVPELQKSINAHSLRSIPAGCLLLLLVLKLSLFSLAGERSAVYGMGTLDNLQRDLTALNEPNLSGHIQCLDMTLGSCLNVLYRMQLVQSTGYIADFYLFPSRATPLTDDYQRQFYRMITATPPRVFVLSSQTWPGEFNSYAQLGNFPLLQHYLESNYVVTKEYSYNIGSLAGYKIFVHK